MRIIQITAEIAPVAKVGGLGDVVYGLSRALIALGHDVSVVLPRYASMLGDAIRDLSLAGTFDDATIFKGIVDGIPVYFFEFPAAFRGSDIYGSPTDSADFIHFSWVASRWICALEKAPDIVHLHDWHVSAVALFPKTTYRVIGTIHNISYQGIVDISLFDCYNLDPALIPSIQQEGTPHQLNLLKGLILYSHRVNTVSLTYAWEVTHTSEGRGLEGVLAQIGSRFSGILNGIDYGYWDPATDIHLPFHYSPEDISNKALVTRDVRSSFGLDHSSRPLVGIVSRLVPQKGVYLMEHALHQVDKYGIQLILSGIAFDWETSSLFSRLQEQFATHPNARVLLSHDERLAHYIYAGSDLFLIPSIFEPCGLTQMISMRYGSVPLGRHTGGLADTIVDVDNSGKPFSEANGFCFLDPDPMAMDEAMDRAVRLWNEQPGRWSQLQLQGMRQDFSWKNSAKQYLDLYYSL